MGPDDRFYFVAGEGYSDDGGCDLRSSPEMCGTSWYSVPYPDGGLTELAPDLDSPVATANDKAFATADADGVAVIGESGAWGSPGSGLRATWLGTSPRLLGRRPLGDVALR